MALAALLCAGIQVAVGCGGAPAVAPQDRLMVPATPPLATVAVRRGDVVLTQRVSGEVVSTRTTPLFFHNGGTVASVDVTDGQVVHRGQLLASLDTGDLPFQIDAARLNVERDRLSLQAQQAGASVPTSAAAAQQAVLQLRQAQLQLEQDQVALADQLLLLREDEVVAPFAGVVNDVSIVPGDQVGGFQTVMVLSDPASESFRATVSQTVAAALRPGQRAVLALNAAPGRRYAAEVASVFVPSLQQIAQAQANGQPIPTPSVTFSIRGPTARLPLGATFTATVTLAEAHDVLYVPSDAVRQFSGFYYVDVLRRGVEAEVPVRLGVKGDTTTAILHGVAEGERVIEP